MKIAHKKIEKVRSSLNYIPSSVKRKDMLCSVCDDLNLNATIHDLYVESRLSSTFNMLSNL